MEITRFNVRVYGILKNSLNEILVSDELVKKGTLRVTKFPGGGLDFGEGLREGLQREFMEEAGVYVEVQSHIYTTDFFVPSAFDNDSQIIAVYFWVNCEEWQKIKVSTTKFNFEAKEGQDAECFRWVPLDTLAYESHLTLPTDKALVQLITA